MAEMRTYAELVWHQKYNGIQVTRKRLLDIHNLKDILHEGGK
jgi:hypothetical protein